MEARQQDTRTAFHGRSTAPHEGERYAFGDFALDARRFELRRAGRVVPLEPKVLDVLLHLVRRRDHLVTKNELLDTVWGDADVGESVLTRAVSLIRRALGERGRGASWIRTVPRRGYQFRAPVRALADPRSGREA